MRKKLIELLKNSPMLDTVDGNFDEAADYLIENGIIVTPCDAMVEQFIKNGKLDKRITTHEVKKNGSKKKSRSKIKMFKTSTRFNTK